MRSANTDSMIACWRWVISASGADSVLLVKNGWLNPPGESGDSKLIELCYPIDNQTAIVDSLQFHGRHIPAVFIEAPVVEPVQVRGCFRLDVIRIPPRPPRLDQLRLVQPIDRFSERIIMRIANRTDRRINAGLDEPFGEPDGRIQASRVIVMN